jgi:hypothetical protein
MIPSNPIQIIEEMYFTALQEWWIRPIDSPEEFKFAEMCYNKQWEEYEKSYYYGVRINLTLPKTTNNTHKRVSDQISTIRTQNYP